MKEKMICADTEKGKEIINTATKMAAVAIFFIAKSFGCGHTTQPKQVSYEEWKSFVETCGEDEDGYAYSNYVQRDDSKFYAVSNAHWYSWDHFTLGKYCPDCMKKNSWAQEQLHMLWTGAWVKRDRWIMSLLFGRKITYKYVYTCGCEEVYDVKIIDLDEFLDTSEDEDDRWIRVDPKGNGFDIEEHSDVNNKCDTCSAFEIACEEQEHVDEAIEQEKMIDPRYNDCIWVHCLDAYRGKDMRNIIEHANCLFDNNGFELCCSDPDYLCGSIGVTVQGTVTGAFDYDCYSEIDKNTGKRYSTRANFIGDDIEKISSDHNDYHEVWVKDFMIKEIVVRPTVRDTVLSFARKLARCHNIPLFMVVNHDIHGYRLDPEYHEEKDVDMEEGHYMEIVSGNVYNHLDLSEWLA